MNIIGNILLFVLIAFTIFNIYATATKKKRDAANEAKYNALFAPIDQKILNRGKEWKGNSVKRLITEKEEGIVCVRDDNRKKAVIGWEDDLREFPFSAFNGAELISTDTDTKVLVHIDGETLTLTCREGKFKKKSFISKYVDQMAKDFVDFLNVINNPPEPEEKKDEE